MAQGRHLLIIAAPVGFGPASKAWLIAEEMRATHAVVISATFDSADFLQNTLSDDVTVQQGIFQEAFPDRKSLARFDAVISVNHTPALSHLAALGYAKRTIFVDSLTHWRAGTDDEEVPPDLLAYLVQDYPPADGQPSGAVKPGRTVVAPIIWRDTKKRAPAKRAGVLIHTGGMSAPAREDIPVRQAIACLFGPVLAETLERSDQITIMGNRHAAACIPGSEKARILAEVNPARAAQLIADTKLLITTPGIGAVYEAMNCDTPILLLPPTNSTQMLHYRVLTSLGIAGTLDEAGYKDLARKLEEAEWQEYIQVLLSEFATGSARLLAKLIPLLDSYLIGKDAAARNQTAATGRKIFSGLANVSAIDAIRTAIGTLAPLPSPSIQSGESGAQQADPLKRFVTDLPKVELHLHLEGALAPGFVMAMARRNRIAIPGGDPATYFAKPGGHDFRNNFKAFANRLLFSAHCLRRPQDFEDAVAALGPGLVRSRIRYAEIMWTPQLYLNRGLPLNAILAALNRGRAKLFKSHRIAIRWIIDLVRSYPEPALKITQWACRPEIMAQGIVALGLGGPEAGHRAAPFAECFNLARSCGLGINPHAGENAGADSITEVLDLLKPDRIAHGIRAVEDPAVMARIAASGIVLDVCPTSNIQLGVAQSYAELGLDRLRKAGCKVTLNTDDPALFGTNLNREYWIAAQHCGLSAEALGQCILTAVDATRLPAETKNQLRTWMVPQIENATAAYLAAK